MEYIRKQIYSRPEIRRTLLPLWSAWALTAVGVLCGAIYILHDNISTGASSALLGGMVVGGCGLVTVLCYWIFGDSRRPYCKDIHAVLEPTYTYYSFSQEKQLVDALERGDEAALDAVKRQANPELALVRYSDRDERVFYSQLTRVEGHKYIPLTDIFVNHKQQSK
ncbi:MAG: hypothetical protein II975_05045 [Bacteroidales bacterium]|nr:hypothetical protein [Bacteroidales bacterium]